MAAPVVWNVFLPDNLFTHSSAYLTGRIDESKSSVYVTGVCSTYVNSQNEPIIGSLSFSKTQSRMPDRPALARQAIRLSVSKSSTNSVHCRVFLSDTDDPCKCVCVLFEPRDILSSFVLAERCETESRTHAEYQSQLSSLFGVYKNKCTTRGTEKAGRNFGDHRSVLEKTFAWYLHILIVVFTVMEWLLGVISFKWCWSPLCVQSPAVISHISYKLNRFKRAQSVHALQRTSKLV